jgi:Putative Flp pilus-assembly TadE/G-like
MIFQSYNQFGKPAVALGRLICDLRTCSAGVVAVVTALVLPVLLGFTSLGVEVGHWYVAQRQMQGAADAAAISAAAEYIADFPTNPNSTNYQNVGVSYASLNGFTIPTSNVCLVTANGDNCSSVRSLDLHSIVCANPPCVVVEITQNTATWLTTKGSLEPGAGGFVQSIPTPTLKARAIVSAISQTTTTTTNGTDCILALANDTQAVLVHGNGNLQANCGIAIDGGRDQNVNGTPLGGITFNGSPSIAHITNLVVASNSTGCPSSHCFLYNPSTTALPASAILTNTATPDPYASLTFPTVPLGVQTGGVAVVAGSGGSGYTNGTRTFTVVGGTGTAAKFTATVVGGKVTAIRSVIDPGAYTVFPTSPVTARPDTGSATTAATFTLTEGCFTWANTAIAGRKYCSITPSGTLNFPTGSYYIAGGDSNCAGFCISGGGNHVTSDVAGVTFYLTNGDGTHSLGASSYATVSISGFGNNSTLALCSPGTNCGTGCTGSCLLFVQGAPAAVLAQYPVPQSTSQGTPGTTVSAFSGNGNSTLSGLIYLPKQTFQTQGNSTIGGCFGVVAKYIDVGGTPLFSNGCLPGNGIGGTTTTQTTWGTPYLYQ